MQALKLKPTIYYFDTFNEFLSSFQLGEGDLLVTNQWIYDPYIKPLRLDLPVIFQEKYGAGEPSDEMIDAIARDIRQYDFQRLIALGGGTVIDICKILCLELPEKSMNIFMGKTPPMKTKELIVVPTTCGTGSEVTNVAVASIKKLNIKKGFASEETFADMAVIIPEALESLPDKIFATSSIDALVHASESYLSPKATMFTEMYSLKSVEMIVKGYMQIVKNGGNHSENRKTLLKNFCLAATYAGIAFGNAGCGAVHALSYSIGSAFHVPHGEANYQFFTEVFEMYLKKHPQGKIETLNHLYAEILDCDESIVYKELSALLNQIMIKKPLREYGMIPAQIDEFTRSTMEQQQRLLANNYVPLSDEDLRKIFKNLF